MKKYIYCSPAEHMRRYNLILSLKYLKELYSLKILEVGNRKPLHGL